MAQYQVERLMVPLGIRGQHEDDARRAVHTGLEDVEGIAELTTTGRATATCR